MIKKISLIMILSLIHNLSLAGCGADSVADIFSEQAINNTANLNNQALISIVAIEAKALATAIDAGTLNQCLKDSKTHCLQVYRAAIKYIKKLITPKYRMTHSIYTFRPDKVTYNADIAKQISQILVKLKS